MTRLTPRLPRFAGSAALAVTLLLFATAAGAQTQSEHVCAQSGDREQVECLAQKIDAANQTLQSVYAAALAKMLATDPADTRRRRAQLEHAQTAWKAYIEANCAYVGGAEGGSNQWITNFASRCQLRAIEDRTAFLRARSSTQNSSVPNPAPPNRSASALPITDTLMTPQGILNFLATPMPHNANNPAPPTSFVAWTDAQRRLIPRQTIARCTTIWGMMNPVSPIRLLPPEQNQADSGKLALEVCVTANLPKDWPTHASAIADIHRILHRSAELGQPLTLPATF